MATKFDGEEKIINWEEEATAIINDVKAHVGVIEISKKLPSTQSNVFLNLRTFEGNEYCIRVSSMGFRIVGNGFEKTDEMYNTDEDEEEYFETPYALLDKISPRYIESFGSQLVEQLSKLQQSHFNEEDEDDINDDENAERTNEVIPIKK